MNDRKNTKIDSRINPLSKIDDSWSGIMEYLELPEVKELNVQLIKQKYYPPPENIFEVFSTPLSDIKVVILGQDPYYRPGYAVGRAFAVPASCKLPASLRVIQKEVYDEGFGPDNETGTFPPEWKTLDHWTKQGVFLLNTALTVQKNKPLSHTKYWKGFITKTIEYVAMNLKKPCVWLLWGKKAQKFKKHIINTTLDNSICGDFNYILEAAHPAAESYSYGKAGFYGCNHFTQTNKILTNNKLKPINW